MRNVTILLLALAVLVLLAASPPRASADALYTIGLPNSAISGFPPPYATVDVHLVNSTHAMITFTSLLHDGFFYLMGGHGAADVNVNASRWTIGGFSSSNSGTGFTPGPLSNGGSGNVDGFGVFNQTINSFDGFAHSSTQISFTLTNSGGTWASAGSVLKPNADGLVAAIHVFVCGVTGGPSTCKKNNGALATGFGANGTVPEPGALMLLFAGLASLGGWFAKLGRVSLPS